MATYSNINRNSDIDVTPNYKFPLMGNDYQTSNIIYRVNLEKLSNLLKILINNSLIKPRSGENSEIYGVSCIDNSDYGQLEEETEDRKLYIVKEV